MNFKKILADRIRLYREEHGIKQLEMAMYLEISETTYSDYECQRIQMPLEKLIMIAEYLNVSIDYLVGRTNNPNVNYIKKKITF